MKIWIAYETDGCEASWAIGHFLSRESALDCCEQAYRETKKEAEEAYGPNSERPEPSMLWPELRWTKPKGRYLGLWQTDSNFSPGFMVGDEPIEVLP